MIQVGEHLRKFVAWEQPISLPSIFVVMLGILITSWVSGKVLVLDWIVVGGAVFTVVVVLLLTLRWKMRIEEKLESWRDYQFSLIGTFQKEHMTYYHPSPPGLADTHGFPPASPPPDKHGA